MNERTLGVKNVDVSTLTGAEAAIVVIDQAIGKVSEKRATMGSLQNKSAKCVAIDSIE